MSEIEALIQSYTIICVLAIPMLVGTVFVLIVRALLQLGLRWIVRRWRDHHPVSVPDVDAETT